MFRKVNTDDDKQHLINNLDKLFKCSKIEQNLMLLIFFYCKSLHTGHDLGITISADMKVSEQCVIAASMGNQILGLIGKKFTYKEKANYTTT